MICQIYPSVSMMELRNPDACLAFIKKQTKDQKPYYLLIDEVQYKEYYG